MKKWKYLLITSIIGIIAYLGIVIYYLIESISYRGNYPYPTIAGDVNNWIDRFIVNSAFTILPFTPIFIILIILLIVSIKKIKNKNN